MIDLSEHTWSKLLSWVIIKMGETLTWGKSRSTHPVNPHLLTSINSVISLQYNFSNMLLYDRTLKLNKWIHTLLQFYLQFSQFYIVIYTFYSDSLSSLASWSQSKNLISEACFNIGLSFSSKSFCQSNKESSSKTSASYNMCIIWPHLSLSHSLWMQLSWKKKF